MDQEKLMDDAILIGASLDWWKIEIVKWTQEADRLEKEGGSVEEIEALQKRLTLLLGRSKLETANIAQWEKNFNQFKNEKKPKK
jgi:flagellar motor switch/type III secretory pathway protein FliN